MEPSFRSLAFQDGAERGDEGFLPISKLFGGQSGGGLWDVGQISRVAKMGGHVVPHTDQNMRFREGK